MSIKPSRTQLPTKLKNITLKEFLIKYTAVSIRFIEEYYKFYEMCEVEKYGIEVRDVITYLEIKHTERFIKGLKEKFVENKDYVKTEKIVAKTKNDEVVKYMLNIDTFERICMASHAKKANDVRDYFITLRKFINYYKDGISNMILDETKTHNYIYILSVNKHRDIFKLGMTTDIRKRLKTYATGADTHPDIRYIVTVNNPRKIEKCAKLILQEMKLRGKEHQELYQVDFDTLKRTVCNCIEAATDIEKFALARDLNHYIVFG